MTKIIIKVGVKVYDNIRIIHIPETEVTVPQFYVQTGTQRGQIMKIFISCSLKNKKDTNIFIILFFFKILKNKFTKKHSYSDIQAPFGFRSTVTENGVMNFL